MGAVDQAPVGLIRLSFSSLVVLWHEFTFHKPVELIEQDIRKQRAEDRTLWNSAQRFVELPFFHISCIQQFFDKSEKPSILDVFSECREDEIMIQAAKTVCDVALNDPGGAFPGVIDFPKSRVAPSFRTEAMRMFAECPIEIGIQDHSHHLG